MPQFHALRKLVVVQAKISLRDPMTAFFIFAFAPLYLVVMGLIFGNVPVDMFGGRDSLSVAVPTYAAIVMAVVSFFSVPIDTAGRRETGTLRRFRATPLRPATYIAGDVLVNLVMTLLGILFLFILGWVLYGVRPEGNPLALAIGVLLSVASFLAFGYVLAALVPNSRAVPVLGNLLMFPSMILAGTTVPLEVMSAPVRAAADYVPLKHVVTLLRGLWFGEPFSAHLTEVAVLSGVLVVATAIAARTFRWE